MVNIQYDITVIEKSLGYSLVKGNLLQKTVGESENVHSKLRFY